MSQRERILAAAVGGLAVLAAAFFGMTTLGGMLKQKKDRLAALEKQVSDKEWEVTLGKRASARMQEFAERSLPSDRDLARSAYQSWLLEQLERAELKDANVTAPAARPRGDVYSQHFFTINGQGELGQLTNFLYDFYDRDLLHRIRGLRVAPVAESKVLDLTIQIEVLSLTDAPAKGPLPSGTSNRLALSREQYLEAILNRNLFGPANNPPRIASLRDTQVERGGRLSVEVTARDPDERQTLRYSLAGRPPSGMRIDERTGRIEWTARDLGRYQVTVQVADDGLPVKRDEATFTVAVVEPPAPRSEPAPPPSPKFDIAQFSVVTGITETAGRRQVWINVRPEGRIVKLHEGDPIQIGDVQGIIRQIAKERVLIATGDDMLVVALNEALTDGAREPLFD